MKKRVKELVSKFKATAHLSVYEGMELVNAIEKYDDEWEKIMKTIDVCNEIRRMKAGKELDLMVHEAFNSGTLFLWDEGYSNYSKDLNQAWSIASRVPLWWLGFAYHADFTVSLSFRSPNKTDFVEADTPAEALCKAALICKVAEKGLSLAEAEAIKKKHKSGVMVEVDDKC